MTAARSCHGQSAATVSWPLESVGCGAPPPAYRGNRVQLGMALLPMNHRGDSTLIALLYSFD